jgi:methylase of polypeptide subunit release factors
LCSLIHCVLLTSHLPSGFYCDDVPDALFADPRLARLYDLIVDDRRDLDAYLALARGFGARSVIDVGCGTGTLAVALAGR